MRPFRAAGWTAGDLEWAIDHEPSGRQHPYPVRDIRNIPGTGGTPPHWALARIRHRLALWLDDRGAATASRTQQAAAKHTALLAEQELRRAEKAAAAAAWTDPAPHAAAIRAAMGWKAPTEGARA